MKWIPVLILLSFFSQAENVGLSAYEFQKKNLYLSAEMLSRLSIDEGLGFQARFTQVRASKLSFDGGYGFHAGDRDHRLFIGASYEVLPDHGLQPRISIKAIAEAVNNNDSIASLVGVVPIFSKGVSFYRFITYPFVAVPVKRLIGNNSDFEVALTWGAGIKFSEDLIFTFESNINLRNTPGSLFIGISTSL